MKGTNDPVDRYGRAGNYWWLTMILGIAVFVVGIVVFMRPAESYIGLAVAFGLLILASGIIQIFVGAYTTRGGGGGWLIAGGIIETVLGIILLFNIGLSAAVMPYFLAFWLIFRGFTLVGISSDMRSVGVKGTGYTIALGIILVVLAFLVLIYPLIGIGAIVVWVGLSFLVAGVGMVMYSLSLRTCRDCA